MKRLRATAAGLPDDIRSTLARALAGIRLEMRAADERPLEGLARGETDLAIVPAGEFPFPRPSGIRVRALIESGRDGAYVAAARAGDAPVGAALWPLDARLARGKVWIAGFGPGDPDLMTVRLHRILERADVILYDDLVRKSALERYRARRVYVGKRKHCHEMSQESINESLYREARAGRRVARVKGGDPFIFGRGGEEAEYLGRRHVPVEVVPGVSSANAAAAAFGVPLTQRLVSSSVTFRTLHGSTGGLGTRVYFMGATRTRELAADLAAEGFPPGTPVALLRDVSGLGERGMTTDLAGLAGFDIASPVIIIVGEAAGRGREPESWLRFEDGVEAPVIAERVVTFTASSAGERTALAGFDGVVITSRDDLERLEDLCGSWPETLIYGTGDEEARRLLSRAGRAVVPFVDRRTASRARGTARPVVNEERGVHP